MRWWIFESERAADYFEIVVKCRVGLFWMSERERTRRDETKGKETTTGKRKEVTTREYPLMEVSMQTRGYIY